MMEEGVDVVLNPLNILPIYALQLGLQVLEVDLRHNGKTDVTKRQSLVESILWIAKDETDGLHR